MQSVFWLQQFPFLSPLMKGATWLGNEEFFLLLLPLIYLCVSRKNGLRLGALILGCDALCGIVKIAFALPRPYWLDARAATLATENSFGFPSSHAQVAAAGWLFLARQSKEIWAYCAALFLICLIAVSRVFLGVHFPGDVVGGFLIGVAFLVLFLKLAPRFECWFGARNLVVQIGISAAVSLGIIALFAIVRVLVVPDSSLKYAKFLPEARAFDGIVARAGALFGLGCGAALAQRFARFEIEGTFAQKIARFVIAIFGVALVYFGLALLSPRSSELAAQSFRFVRYVLLALWVTFGAPLLLLKIGLLKHRFHEKERAE